MTEEKKPKSLREKLDDAWGPWVEQNGLPDGLVAYLTCNSEKAPVRIYCTYFSRDGRWHALVMPSKAETSRRACYAADALLPCLSQIFLLRQLGIEI